MSALIGLNAHLAQALHVSASVSFYSDNVNLADAPLVGDPRSRGRLCQERLVKRQKQDVTQPLSRLAGIKAFVRTDVFGKRRCLADLHSRVLSVTPQGCLRIKDMGLTCLNPEIDLFSDGLN